MAVRQTKETAATEIASPASSVTRFVYLDLADGLATIRLDHPPRNVIDLRAAAQLHDAALEVGHREDIRAVVIWGGERIFSAGGDVELMSDRSADTIRPVITALAEALVVLEAIPKVVIAAINGICLGGGCEIALAADFRFASETALLGQPEIRFGIIPGAGATQRMPRLIGSSAAKDLIYSGRRVKARGRSNWGWWIGFFPVRRSTRPRSRQLQPMQKARSSPSARRRQRSMRPAVAHRPKISTWSGTSPVDSSTPRTKRKACKPSSARASRCSKGASQRLDRSSCRVL